MEELKITPPERFALPRRLVRLPDPGLGGTELVIEIEYCHPGELLPLLKGLPGLTAPPAGSVTIDQALEAITTAAPTLRKVAERVVTHPKIDFAAATPSAAKTGHVAWCVFTQRNQRAIPVAALAFCSLAQGNPAAEERAAQALGRFPDDAHRAEGGAGGGGDGETAPAGAAPAADVLGAGPAAPAGDRPVVLAGGASAPPAGGSGDPAQPD